MQVMMSNVWRTSRSRRAIGLCCSMAMLALCAWHRDAAAQLPSGSRIGHIFVEGNTKTGADLIVAASELHPGMLVEDATLGEARQRIFNKRIFSEVQVETVNYGEIVDLRIVVKERWTLIPIPFISSSDGQTRGGVFLLESNLFGRMNMLAAGVTFSNQGSSIVGFYRAPSLFGTPWGTRLSALHSVLSPQRRDGADVVYSHHETRTDLAAALSYKLTRQLYLYGGAFYVHANPSMKSAYAPPNDLPDLAGLSAELELNAANYRSYFDEGLVLKASHRQGIWGRDATQSRFNLTLASRTFDDQSASIVLQYMGATGNSYVDAHRLGGQIGTRGFTPLGLWADHAGTATVEYQVPLAHFAVGTWTVNAFCDTGRVIWNSQAMNFVTPGLSTRFYLNRIALPAVGLDVSYSTHDNRLVTSASAGMSF